jgi:predicted transcriptional regulator of viral defense system
MSSRDIMATQVALKPGLGPREALLLGRIQRSGRAVIRVRRDRELFRGFEPNALRLVLKGLADGGWIHRIERGVYTVGQPRGLRTQPQLALIADWLEGENYVVSGFFALAHWNLTIFPATTVDVLLDRRRPNVSYGQTLFRFIYVPADRLPRWKDVRVAGARALARVVPPERALADVLSGKHATDFATAVEAFKRGLRLGVLQRRRLIQVVRDAPATAVRRLGWIAEHEHDTLAAALQPFVGNGGYVALDPTRDTTGAKRNVNWRVLENVELA